MANRKAIWLCATLLGLVLAMAGAGLWVRAHLAQTAEYLIESFTDKGAAVESVEFQFLPAPAVVVTNLRAQFDGRAVRLPRARFVPALKGILSGRIHLTEVVLDEPYLAAPLLGEGGDESFALSGGILALMPDRLRVERAQLLLTDEAGNDAPLTISAEAEKTAVGLNVRLNRVAIKEFGLEFSGSVAFGQSGSPSVTVAASRAAFDPTAFHDFLDRFGYLDSQMLAVFKGVRKVDAQGLGFHYDARADTLSLEADVLQFDSNILKQLRFELSGGRMAVSCESGTLQAENVLSMARRHPESLKALDGLLTALSLKKVIPEGTVAVAGLKLVSEGGDSGLSGTVSLRGDDLWVKLVSESGEEQALTFNALDITVDILRGQPSVTINRAAVVSDAGGEMRCNGEFPFPYRFETVRLHAAAHSFGLFGTVSDCTIYKNPGQAMEFSFSHESGDLDIETKGVARLVSPATSRVEASLAFLGIRSRQQTGEPERDFNFAALNETEFHGRASIKTFKYNELPGLNDVTLEILSGNGKTVLTGNARFCKLTLDCQASFGRAGLASQVEVRSQGVNLTGFIGCFSQELPVFLDGRVFIKGNLFMQGNRPSAVKKSLAGSVTVSLRPLRVLKLSRLDSRLAFFLDILNAANLQREEEDSLSFSRGQIRVALADGRVLFDTFSLRGQLLDVWGGGDFDMDGKRLRLNATVKTSMGFTNRISIDKRLIKNKG